MSIQDVAALMVRVETALEDLQPPLAARTAQEGARRGVEASGVLEASQRLTGASEALLEALQASQARERRLRPWRALVLVLGLLLAGLAGGLGLSTTEIGCAITGGTVSLTSDGGTWCYRR